MTRQGALTVILNVKPAEQAALRNDLDTIGTNVERNDTLQFRRSRRTHFARFVLLDNGGRLLFTSTYDGTEEEYLREVRDALGGGMREILKHCQDCPDASSFDEGLVGYLQQHSLPTQTFYVAFPGRTVEDIAAGERARLWLDVALDKLSNCLGSPSPAAWLVAGDSQSREEIAELKAEQAAWPEKLVDWAVGIRPERTQPTALKVQESLTAIEDKPGVVQNQMTVIVNNKRSLWSRLLLRLVLWAANRQVRNSNGSLSDISTIHFARWTLIDHGTKLLFESNYDGSWERYIDDFVDRASMGLNGIWGNTLEYPRGGARDIEAFKKSIRDNQIPAQVFYSAYPDKTVVNIFNDLHCAQQMQDRFAQSAQELASGTLLMPT